jgi:hypothetical protein
MAERQPIKALVTVATRDLLRQASQERKCSQGELVEQALLALLRPGETAETEPLLFARLLAIEEVLGQLMGMMQVMVTLQEAQVKRPDPPPIATYEQMYGPIDAEPAPDEDAPAPRVDEDVPVRPAVRQGWRRWFVREESS